MDSNKMVMAMRIYGSVIVVACILGLAYAIGASTDQSLAARIAAGVFGALTCGIILLVIWYDVNRGAK